MLLRKQGFTLVELLVVVLIIGILSAVALPQYTKTVEKARASEAVSTIYALEKAIDLWVLANGFPSTDNDTMIKDDELDISFSCDSFDSENCCLTKNFRYCPFCWDNGDCEVETYRINSSTYYPLIA